MGIKVKAKNAASTLTQILVTLLFHLLIIMFF